MTDEAASRILEALVRTKGAKNRAAAGRVQRFLQRQSLLSMVDKPVATDRGVFMLRRNRGLSGGPGEFWLEKVENPYGGDPAAPGLALEVVEPVDRDPHDPEVRK